MNWIYYMLEVNLYLLVFYFFYRMFLIRETFYSINRYCLIGATFLSFLLPIVQAGFLFELFPGFANSNPIQGTTAESAAGSFSYLSIDFLIPAVYFMVLFLFMVRVLKNLVSILALAYHSKFSEYGQVKYFELTQDEIAFSFFGLLFMNPSAKEKDVIIRHEQVHMRQYHSLDTLMLELVHALSWFNPILYFLKKDLNTLHEFIADDLTTSGSLVGKHNYAMLLIHNSFGMPINPLSKPIYNQSSLKQRITMLNQKKSASGARLRLLLLLPLSVAMICISTLAFSKDYKLIDLYAGHQTGTISAIQDTTKRLPPPPPPKAPRPPKRSGKALLPAPPPPRKPGAPAPPIAAKPVKGEMPVPPPPPPVAPVKKS